jgi:hypothetical protein
VDGGPARPRTGHGADGHAMDRSSGGDRAARALGITPRGQGSVGGRQVAAACLAVPGPFGRPPSSHAGPCRPAAAARRGGPASRGGAVNSLGPPTAQRRAERGAQGGSIVRSPRGRTCGAGRDGPASCARLPRFLVRAERRHGGDHARVLRAAGRVPRPRDERKGACRAEAPLRPALAREGLHATA